MIICLMRDIKMKLTLRSKKAFQVKTQNINKFMDVIETCMLMLKDEGIEVETILRLEK